MVTAEEQWNWLEVHRLGLLSPPFSSPVNTAHHDVHSRKSRQQQQQQLELEEEPPLEEPAVTAWAIPVQEEEPRGFSEERGISRRGDTERKEEAMPENGRAEAEQLCRRDLRPSSCFDGMEPSSNNGAGRVGGDGKGGSGNDEKPPPPPPTAAFGDLFRFADALDYILMAVGTVGAIVHGCSLPVFLRFFANLVHSFGSNADDPELMVHQVIKVAAALYPLPPHYKNGHL